MILPVIGHLNFTSIGGSWVKLSFYAIKNISNPLGVLPTVSIQVKHKGDYIWTTVLKKDIVMYGNN